MTEQFVEIFEVKIRRNADTGIVEAEHWLFNGKGESPGGERPSTILYDDQGRVKTMLWKKQGKDHRTNGPAWIDINPENGVHTMEQFCVDGQCHRSGRQPAQIRRNPETGEITQARYFEYGVEKFWKNKPPIASLG